VRIATLALALIGAAIWCGVPHAVGRRPNVVMLVMDTTRADRCSFLGYDRPTTPRLAEFAKDAVAFRDAWSPAGWTGPAHASLFTGLRPERHGFHEGDVYWLAESHPTIAQDLAAAGYATACFTNNDWITPAFGLSRGFAKAEEIWRLGRVPYPTAATTHALAADWAQERSRAGLPFFLYVNDMEPHLPYTPPPGDERRFVRADPSPEELAAARAFDFPRTTAYALRAEELSPRELRLLSDRYDAEIAALDREIGAFLDRLATAGLLENTLVVVAGDHGELFGEHHMTEHAFSLHRAVRHVPLLLRMPGRFDGGRVVGDVVRLEDVAPTVAEVCGLPRRAGLDGASLLHGLEGRVSRGFLGENPKRRAWFMEAVPGADPSALLVGIQAVYDGRFHYLERTDGRTELHDCARDPDERENLVGRAPADAARLAALLRSP
jgi:arylsulfatase A-like enzyme